MIRYRMDITVENGEASFQAIEIDDMNNDIRVGFFGLDFDEVVEQITTSGGVVIKSKCAHCGNVQYDIWAACHICGCGAMVGVS